MSFFASFTVYAGSLTTLATATGCSQNLTPSAVSSYIVNMRQCQTEESSVRHPCLLHSITISSA